MNVTFTMEEVNALLEATRRANVSNQDRADAERWRKLKRLSVVVCGTPPYIQPLRLLTKAYETFPGHLGHDQYIDSIVEKF